MISGTGACTAPAIRRRLVAALLLVLGALVPAQAFAHGTLRSSVPSAGSRLSTVPHELRLNFSESPELTFTTIALIGPDGATVALGPVQIASDARRAAVAAIRGALSDGTYTVVWKMAGADGHPIPGRFTFTIAPGAQGFAAATPAAPAGEAGASVTAPGRAPPDSHHVAVAMTDAGAFDSESPLYVAVRWLLYTGLLVVLGTVVFQFAVLGLLRRRQDPDSPTVLPILMPVRDRAAAVGLAGAAVVAVAMVLRLYAQSYAMHGPERVLDGSLVISMLSGTVWGWGWLLQLAGVVIAATGFRAATGGRVTGWGIAAVGAASLAFSPALSGHAASAPQLVPLAILADGFHVIGAGGWLGSLLVLVTVGLPAALRLDAGARGPAVAALVNALSPTALGFAGITAASGVFTAWLHLDAVSALWQTPYGQTLLLKLAILSVVAATGAYNWRRVKPTLGVGTGAARLRRSASVELAVGALVLVVTAVLVATPTPRDLTLMGP